MSPRPKKKQDEEILLEETSEEAEEEKPESPKYKVNQILADVKIIDIKPDVERSIYFVYAKRKYRGENAPFESQPVLKGGKMIGQEPVWDEEHPECMTPEDFKEMIDGRLRTGNIITL